MLYVNSGSPIEQALFDKLSFREQVVQFNVKQILNKRSLYDAADFTNEKILLYSFQQLDFFKHIQSFEAESNMVDHLLQFVIENKFEKIIIFSYPGAYFNANNLFLQYKGYIEQKFIASGIPCATLHVQAIHDPEKSINNLHELFYDEQEHKYLIPQKSSCIVYSVKITHLLNIITQCMHRTVEGKFDVFDTIYELKTFLQQFSHVEKVQRIAPLYLYFKSYLGTYASPTMLELFLITIVPMFKFRTEKEFDIILQQESHGLFITFNQPLQTSNDEFSAILKYLVPVK